MPYVIGRRGRETYPEAPRGGSGGASFARNFASGPKGDTPISTEGNKIQWNAVDAGLPPTPADVPITPITSGVLLITGVIMVNNTGDTSVAVLINVQVENVSLPVPVTLGSTVEPGEGMAIPFMYETTPTDTPVGVTKNIQVLVTASVDGVSLLDQSSVIEVQEVSVATG